MNESLNNQRRKPPVTIPSSVWVITGILAFWQGATLLSMVSPLLLPSPYHVFLWLLTHLGSSALWFDLAVTLGRVLGAFVIAALIGIPSGMILGYLPAAERAVQFPIDFSRSIPATALFPLFLLLFGTGEGSRVAAAVYGASLIILLSSLSGVKQANIVRITTARAYGANGWRLMWHILLPEALPSIITGCRLGVSLSFVIIVLVEMFVGSSSGLGHRIMDAQMLYEIPQMYATIMLTGLVGYLLNLAFAFAEERIVHYAGH